MLLLDDRYWLTPQPLAITQAEYDKGLVRGANEERDLRGPGTNVSSVVISATIIISGSQSILPLRTGGTMAVLKKQTVRQIEQLIRDIDGALESDESLTASEQAELTYLAWHFLASLSRWKRRHGRRTHETVPAAYPAGR